MSASETVTLSGRTGQPGRRFAERPALAAAVQILERGVSLHRVRPLGPDALSVLRLAVRPGIARFVGIRGPLGAGRRQLPLLAVCSRNAPSNRPSCTADVSRLLWMAVRVPLPAGPVGLTGSRGENMNAHGMQIHRCNRGSFASDVLDLLRGIAAFAVFFGHARSLFLVDYKDVENKGPGVQAFYLVTGFGHQAVMLFFVLSGFFIGGNVLHLMLSGKWSWTSYLISRFTRLYVVLLPGLLATLLCDVAGIH